MSTVEAEILSRFWPRLLGLEQKLPHIFVLRAKEPPQGPGADQVELPHVLSLVLARQNSVKEHNLDYAGKSGILVYHTLDALLQRHRLVG